MNMDDNSSIWTVIGVLVSLFVAIRAYILPVYQKFQRWGPKKTINLVSGLGLIVTSLAMIFISGKADAELYAVIGFSPPFTTPSIAGLTVSQASIFGTFVSFFFSTMMIGSLGTKLGVDRIQKFRKLRSPPFY